MKKLKFLSVLFAFLLLLAACGSNEESAADESNEPADKTEATEGDGQFPMTISPTVESTEDRESGAKYIYEDVTLEKVPENIVVFDYGFLDTLDALGVEGVVGLPKDSSLPEHLSKYEGDEYTNIGTLKEPLLEDIAALEPDIIFISGRQATFYEELKEITPNVLFVGTDQSNYWETFKASVDIAAKIFGKEKEAEEYLANIDAKVEEVKELAGNFDNALVTMYNEGKLSGFGENSRFGYVYDVYGFKPVSADIDASQHGSNFGFEEILNQDPDVLFVIDRTAAVGGQSNIEKDMENDIIKQTKAYKENRIVYLDGLLWYLASGGLQSELAKIEEVLNELK